MIKIIREDFEVDKNEIYDVIIDNLEMLEIANDEIKNLNIKSGQHTIMVRSKSFSSEKIDFSINSGEIIEFKCGPKFTESNLSKIFYKTIFGGKGLYLSKKMDFYL
jgi:hypothetical protein